MFHRRCRKGIEDFFWAVLVLNNRDPSEAIPEFSLNPTRLATFRGDRFCADRR